VSDDIASSVTAALDASAETEPTTVGVADQATTESAETAATTDKQTKPSEAPQVNWDDEANPHYKEAKRLRDEFAGREGSWKQTQAELRAAKAELQRIQQAQQEEQQRQIALVQREALRKKIEEDDGPLAQELRESLKAQEQREAAERELVPRIRQTVYEEARSGRDQEWFAAFHESAEDHSITPEEMNTLGQTKTVREFLKGFIDRGVAKKMGDLDKLVEKSVEARLKTLDTERAAEARQGQSSPDTSVGQPSSRNDDDALTLKVASGAQLSKAERQRAHALLGI
jgi:hypothetical protein